MGQISPNTSISVPQFREEAVIGWPGQFIHGVHCCHELFRPYSKEYLWTDILVGTGLLDHESASYRECACGIVEVLERAQSLFVVGALRLSKELLDEVIEYIERVVMRTRLDHPPEGKQSCEPTIFGHAGYGLSLGCYGKPGKRRGSIYGDFWRGQRVQIQGSDFLKPTQSSH
jgi:hypothetical protein